MGKGRIEYIDFGKGFAILAIVLFHYCQPYAAGIWSQAIMLGGTGVHLFFILSGFGLGLSPKNPGAPAFYKKRFRKILVPYYAVVILIFLANAAWPVYANSSLYALGGHIFLYKMFDERIIGSLGYHFWFISTIIQFYLVFPLLRALEKKSGAAAFMLYSLGASISYAVLITALELSGKRVYNSFFLQYLWEFSLGMVLADLYRNRGLSVWQIPPAYLLVTAAAGIGTMGWLALAGGTAGRSFNDIPASMGFLSLSLLTFTVCRHHLPLIKKTVTALGRISYELYLVHLFILALARKIAAGNLPGWAGIYMSLFLVLPLSICTAWLFMRAARRLAL